MYSKMGQRKSNYCITNKIMVQYYIRAKSTGTVYDYLYPVGYIFCLCMSDTNMDGLVPCDGRVFKKSEYTELYNVLKAFNPHLIIDEDTFRVPDFSNKITGNINKKSKDIVDAVIELYKEENKMT